MQIRTPIPFIDELRLRSNIRWMTEKARSAGVRFRPHFKTHQSAAIGEWFREEGIEAITVSSLRMADYFMAHGWKEQTVAAPLNPLEIERTGELARKGRMYFTVSEGSPVEWIDRELDGEAGIFVEIDTGDHRTGFSASSPERIDRVVELLEKSRKFRFEGFLTHSGQTYDARGKNEIQKVHQETMGTLSSLKERYRSLDPLISIGDTPICSIVEDFEGVDELRPGNFVFYDLMQEGIGACSMQDLAYALLCPVVAKHPDRSELVLYGGAVHLSKDRLEQKDGASCYGIPVRLENGVLGSPYEGSWVRRLSQELAVLCCSEELFREKEVGDALAVLPVHSCLSADAMGEYLLSSGKRVEKFGGG